MRNAGMRNNIGEARKSYELRKGRFTQEDAARYFGVGLSTYRDWEQHRGKLNGEILCRIADLYECSTDYLLCRTNVPDFHAVRSEQNLSEDEMMLVNAYRNSNAQGRATMLAVADIQPGMGGKSQDSARRAV